LERPNDLQVAEMRLRLKYKFSMPQRMPPTKSDRAKIDAASIQFPVRFHSAGCGTVSQMQSDAQSFSAGHMSL
jgi:hypothetical protein